MRRAPVLREQGAFRFEADASLTSDAMPRRIAKADKSHHAGHRARLRERAAISFPALPDYELLELLLARSLPRGDIKPVAKTLLAGVLGATREELETVSGVG